MKQAQVSQNKQHACHSCYTNSASSSLLQRFHKRKSWVRGTWSRVSLAAVLPGRSSCPLSHELDQIRNHKQTVRGMGMSSSQAEQRPVPVSRTTEMQLPALKSSILPLHQGLLRSFQLVPWPRGGERREWDVIPSPCAGSECSSFAASSEH